MTTAKEAICAEIKELDMDIESLDVKIRVYRERKQILADCLDKLDGKPTVVAVSGAQVPTGTSRDLRVDNDKMAGRIYTHLKRNGWQTTEEIVKTLHIRNRKVQTAHGLVSSYLNQLRSQKLVKSDPPKYGSVHEGGSMRWRVA